MAPKTSGTKQPSIDWTSEGLDRVLLVAILEAGFHKIDWSKTARVLNERTIRTEGVDFEQQTNKLKQRFKKIEKMPMVKVGVKDKGKKEKAAVAQRKKARAGPKKAVVAGPSNSKNKDDREGDGEKKDLQGSEDVSVKGEDGEEEDEWSEDLLK